MLDTKFILENKALVKDTLQRRGAKDKLEWVDKFEKLQKKRLDLKKQAESLRHERNTLSAKVREAKKSGADATSLLEQAKQVPQKIKEVEDEQEKIEEDMHFKRMRIPNIIAKEVPFGKDDSENVELRTWGEPKEIDIPLPHGELLEKYNLADFSRSAKMSGSGFFALKNSMVLLQMALEQYGIHSLVRKGYEVIIPPFMLRGSHYNGVTDTDAFGEVMYKIDGEDSYLIATSEHALVSLHNGELLSEADLPKKYVGLSPCFRKEIGSHGVDTRGLFRVHQFTKVEQVGFARPEESERMHRRFQENAEELIQGLGLPHRVVDICSGDIGKTAYRQYDIEAWFPREKQYREIGSCSNCTAYQAVRSNIKFHDVKHKKKEYVHTLNGTAIATSRVMRAIIENFYEDGVVVLPQSLHPYLQGMEEIRLK